VTPHPTPTSVDPYHPWAMTQGQLSWRHNEQQQRRPADAAAPYANAAPHQVWRRQTPTDGDRGVARLCSGSARRRLRGGTRRDHFDCRRVGHASAIDRKHDTDLSQHVERCSATRRKQRSAMERRLCTALNATAARVGSRDIAGVQATHHRRWFQDDPPRTSGTSRTGCSWPPL